MKILIIDDEMNICITLKNILEDEGYSCDYALDAKTGLKLVDTLLPDVILLDVRLEDMNGLEVLERIIKINKEIIIIMISGHSGIQEAVKSIKSGAFDFLEKPLSLTNIKHTIKKAIEFRSISQDYHRLKKSVDERYKIIGEGKAIQDLLEMIRKVAPSNAKILIRGESGTGKELVAYAIHNQSKRNNKPFIKFNSAAIPNELVESELFGFEKGAFTGAHRSKNGKIEQADGGTLFLDEIGDMNLNAQAKILRVIQEGEFERVGGNKTQKINTRIIAATHKNLEELVEQGRFRQDLYYRLNVIPIETPSLRQLPEDIPVLIEYFSKHYANELKIKIKNFLPETISELQSWKFKGNIRELRNLIERIYILIEKENIEKNDILELYNISKDVDFWNQTTQYKDKKREFETRYLSTQLKIQQGNLSRTAEVLGLQVSNLSRKVKELGI